MNHNSFFLLDRSLRFVSWSGRGVPLSGQHDKSEIQSIDYFFLCARHTTVSNELISRPNREHLTITRVPECFREMDSGSAQQLRRGRCVFTWPCAFLCAGVHFCRVDVLRFANPVSKQQKTDSGNYLLIVHFLARHLEVFFFQDPCSG